MAHNLGLETIGEGVEEESQVIGLAEMGCDYTQGFLFSEPLTASSMAAMLEDLADRDHVRRPVDLVIAVDAAPAPVEITAPACAIRRPAAGSSVRDPAGHASARRAVDAAADAADADRLPELRQPSRQRPSAGRRLAARTVRRPAAPLPQARRRTGHDEQLARLLRPLISTGSSDDTDARHDA